MTESSGSPVVHNRAAHRARGLRKSTPYPWTEDFEFTSAACIFIEGDNAQAFGLERIVQGGKHGLAHQGLGGDSGHSGAADHCDQEHNASGR